MEASRRNLLVRYLIIREVTFATRAIDRARRARSSAASAEGCLREAYLQAAVIHETSAQTHLAAAVLRLSLMPSDDRAAALQLEILDLLSPGANGNGRGGVGVAGRDIGSIVELFDSRSASNTNGPAGSAASRMNGESDRWDAVRERGNLLKPVRHDEFALFRRQLGQVADQSGSDMAREPWAIYARAQALAAEAQATRAASRGVRDQARSLRDRGTHVPPSHLKREALRRRR